MGGEASRTPSTTLPLDLILSSVPVAAVCAVAPKASASMAVAMAAVAAVLKGMCMVSVSCGCCDLQGKGRPRAADSPFAGHRGTGFAGPQMSPPARGKAQRHEVREAWGRDLLPDVEGHALR